MMIMQAGDFIESPPLIDDDVVLVQNARADLTRFSDLYQRHARAVYRYLLVRTGNVQDAQDLTSQTFLAAMESLPRYSNKSPFRAWLFGIARHKLADQYRAHQSVHQEVELIDDLPDDAGDPVALVDLNLDIERVSRKLQVIAPDRAEALSLRLFAGFEVKEVAALMGKNEAAVRMLIFRGLRDLQDQLQVVREDGQ